MYVYKGQDQNVFMLVCIVRFLNSYILKVIGCNNLKPATESKYIKKEPIKSSGNFATSLILQSKWKNEQSADYLG